MSDQSSAPSPKPWEPPTGDQEFVFESVEAAPSWIDKGWAGFDQGPALQIPQGNLDGSGPYHTTPARVGDTVKFIAAKGASPAKLVVIRGEPDPETQGTKRPPQQSAASLEDLLRTGMITADDLGEDAKAQVAARTPGLGRMIEDGSGAPDPQPVSGVVKLD